MLTYTSSRDRLQATRRPQNRDVLHKQAGHLAVEFIFICYFMEIEHILFAWEVGAGLLVLPLPALFQIIPKVPPHLSHAPAARQRLVPVCDERVAHDVLISDTIRYLIMIFFRCALPFHFPGPAPGLFVQRTFFGLCLGSRHLSAPPSRSDESKAKRFSRLHAVHLARHVTSGSVSGPGSPIHLSMVSLSMSIASGWCKQVALSLRMGRAST